MSKGPHAQRRGWLKNGNPPGDFLTAPRCGARTRAGTSCWQPSMANGRCRLHGGLSTGPRTPEGRERCRLAPFKHGLRSAEVISLRREAGAARRALRNLIAVAEERSERYVANPNTPHGADAPPGHKFGRGRLSGSRNNATILLDRLADAEAKVTQKQVIDTARREIRGRPN